MLRRDFQLSSAGMAQGKHFLRTILLVVLAALIASMATVCVMSHGDAVNKANERFSSVAPARATFSRFRMSNNHSLSIYWRLRFARTGDQLPGVAIWHLRPFGVVEFAK